MTQQRKMNKKEIQEAVDKGWIKPTKGKDGEEYYMPTKLGKENLDDITQHNFQRSPISYRGNENSTKGTTTSAPAPTNNSFGGISTTMEAPQNFGGIISSQPRPNFDNVFGGSGQSMGGISTTSTMPDLLAQLAGTSQPDYANEYQRGIAEMTNQWDNQRRTDQQNYDNQVGLLTNTLNQQKTQWETTLAEQRKQYEAQTGLLTKQYQDQQNQYEQQRKTQEEAMKKMQTDMEAERNRTGRFDASILKMDATGNEDDELLGSGMEQLQKLKDVYAFDPAKQAEIEAQYGMKMREQQLGVQNTFDEFGNMYNAGMQQFQSGDYKLTDLPSLYGKQSAYNQQLQSKQTSFFGRLADMRNTQAEIERRVSDDAAQISADRLQQKSNLQSNLSQAATANRQQGMINQSVKKNTTNLQRRGIGGTGLLSSYKQ